MKHKDWALKILSLVVMKNESEILSAKRWLITNNYPLSKSSIVGLLIGFEEQGGVMNMTSWDILGGNMQVFIKSHTNCLNNSFNILIPQAYKGGNLKEEVT